MSDSKYQSIFACISDRDGRFEFLPITVQKKGVVSVEVFKGTSICSYMRSLDDVEHKSFVSADIKKGLVKGGIHNNNINNVMSLYRQWQKDFKGYSTKYEWNYLTWFKAMRQFKTKKTSLKNMIEKSVSSLSHNQYKSLFNHYEAFTV